MAVQYISYVKATDGSTYEIKDSWARQQIEAITGGDAVVFKGVSSTALTDGGNENPTVGGTAITAKTTGDLYFYNKEEFIYGDDNKWHSLGPQLQTLGNLAYKDSASGTYTPAGAVGKPTFTGTGVTITAKGTPTGTISQPSFNGTSIALKVSGTPNGSVSLPTPSVTNSTVAVKQVSGVGSLPTYTASVENETLMFTFTQGTLPSTASVNVTTKTNVTLGAATFSGSATTFQTNYTPAGSVSQPTFTGVELSSTASYTPAGDVSSPSFTGNQATITVS